MKVVISLGAYSLPYASVCIRSLERNLEGTTPIHLLTDTPDDVAKLEAAFSDLKRVLVHLSDELWNRPENVMRNYPNIARFRTGHPCWRKITDPLLLADDGEEVVVVDPDVFFFKRFAFEPVGDATLRLMWQRTNCLLPYSVVDRAFEKNIALADHVDIGIAQYRAPLDLQWLDQTINQLGELPPKVLHIEAVIWSALAMHMGGGYLNPAQWHCWNSSQTKRIKMKLGAAPLQMLAGENFEGNVAFHAGGTAKHWLTKPGAERYLQGSPGAISPIAPSAPGLQPFVLFTKEKFAWLKRRSRILETLGYYRMMKSRAPTAIGC